MRQITLSYTPADDDTDGFANDKAGTSGVAFVLDATTVGDGMAHKVIITPSGSVTGNYSLTGTDADDKAQIETLATATTNPVTSAKFYKTLTIVLAPSGIGANTVDIGWTDDAITPTIPVDKNKNPFSIGFGVDISGTIDYTIQHTFADILNPLYPPRDQAWYNHSSVAAKTADADGNYAFNICAVRLLVNSLTAGATVKIELMQGG